MQLDVSHTQVSDVTPLGKLTSLKGFYASLSSVNDLRPLVGMNSLEYLELQSTRVSDVSPLLEMKRLKNLVISGEPITKQQIKELQTALPNCFVSTIPFFPAGPEILSTNKSEANSK